MKKLLLALAAVAVARVGFAVDPVAVWDGDFTTMTQGNYTLSENGNTKTDTNLQISGDNGILITSSQALNVFTVIVRCSGLDLSYSANQVLFTSYAGGLHPSYPLRYREHGRIRQCGHRYGR